jgi:diaminopimelate decarboxylase
MCKLLEREGICLDVVSGGELYTAIKADFPPERIEFNGNNKSSEEINMALDYEIGRFIVDNAYELNLLEEKCKEKNKKANILFRITPGVSSDTHKYITTGTKDSKFGIPLDEDVIFPTIKKALDSNYVNFLGFHYHVGSQLFDNSSHIGALDAVLQLIKEVHERYAYSIKEFNMGGGFGIRYTEKDNPKSVSYFVDPMLDKLSDLCKDIGIPRP